MNDIGCSDIAIHGIDPRALANLIIDLNISRRNSRSYPKGHQVIDAALGKVLATYTSLRETGDEIVVGVACDCLLLGETPLEKSNLIYRDFARVLYERGIGALVLHRGLTIEELRSFIAILGEKREDIYAAGGIERVWEESGISSIEIRAIRYDLFTATEEARVARGEAKAAPLGLWERFARGLIRGQLAAGLDEEWLDPELLAEALNQQFGAGDNAEGGPDFDLGIPLGDLPWGAETHQAELAYRKLAAFVGKLSPGLRRQFLDSTFDIKKIRNEAQAQGLIRHLPADVVIAVLEDINLHQVSVPPFVLGMLQQMSEHGSCEPVDASELADQELREKMRTIFKEHAMEDFIPASYQNKLHRLMSADQIPRLGLEGVRDLMDGFEGASLESKTSDILLLLLSSADSSGEGYAALAQNLSDICNFFLQTGNYAQLLKILRQISCDSIPAETRLTLQEDFVRRAFLDEVLDGLNIWGKGKFEEIGELIWEVGAPFIEALLDRLADTESMSLRRFIMDRLMEFGPVAGPAIIERLTDPRWYFLRNLIAVIRQLELGSAVERLRPLARHQDPRVSLEALRALLQFRDPEAEAQLLRDLDGPGREVQLAAARLAGKSGSAVLLGKLHALLSAPGLSGRECELKGAVVQALGEIGASGSLPVFQAVLASRSLWHPVLLKRLKLEVMAALERYPAAAARPLLAQVARGRGSLAQRAASLIQGNPGRPS
jgi:hypothetical protein